MFSRTTGMRETIGLVLLIACALPAVTLDQIEDGTIPLLLRPGLPRERIAVDYGYDLSPTVDLRDGREGRHGLQRHGLRLTLALPGSEDHSLRLTAGWRRYQLRDDLLIGDSLPVDATIDAVAVGLSGKRLFSSGAALAWRIGVQSSSDHELDERSAIDLSGESLFLGRRDNGDSWMVGLRYDSRLRWPVPIAAYLWQVDETLTIGVGLPALTLRWRPSPRWSIIGAGSPYPARAHLALAYGLGQAGRFGHPYELRARLYRDDWQARPRAVREEDLVLVARSWRTGLALSRRFGPIGNLGLEGGWAFNRSLRLRDETTLFESASSQDIHRIADGWYLRANLALRF